MRSRFSSSPRRSPYRRRLAIERVLKTTLDQYLNAVTKHDPSAAAHSLSRCLAHEFFQTGRDGNVKAVE